MIRIKNTCAAATGTEFTLTVKYVDADTKAEIQGATTMKVIGGQPYTVTSPVITGYTIVNATYTGTMPNNDASVEVLYKKSGVTPTPTITPKPTTSPGINTEEGCKNAGKIWYGNACIASCPAGTVQEGNTCRVQTEQEKCTQIWYGNACIASCPAGTVQEGNTCRVQTEQEKCTQIWYNNACHADWTAACSSEGKVPNASNTGCDVPPPPPNSSPTVSVNKIEALNGRNISINKSLLEIAKNLLFIK
ncbi:MucBP domain-containing protein [Anaerorhabdus sp.]|uniref:MucBP domain-containing protein n=1 Tax=Anaerorhabdus sp. TaxID=1872524 RepID=UPI002B1EB8E4|nr:MucBP domain-containing protein [Anaerorhabdus sp.]MEA4875141.1 MucBP domain-containing protein [Anaerorhabdus sp.]